jgi:hypothetical protein
MKQNIILIDDFHHNPEEVRQFALNAGYPPAVDGYTYPGRNSEKEYYTKEIHDKFENILQENLVPAVPNGYFRLSLEKDSYRQDIHVDPTWKYGAVCYMNSPEQCVDEGGTSFWIHNKTNMEHISLDDIETQNFYGYTSAKEQWFSTVYGSGLDRSQWTRYFLSTMKFNRVVIFKADMWHSHNYNFGDCLENGRMVQLFFFNHTGWD